MQNVHTAGYDPRPGDCPKAFGQWNRQQAAVFSGDRTPSDEKDKWATSAHNDMNEPDTHAVEGKKPVAKQHSLYDSVIRSSTNQAKRAYDVQSPDGGKVGVQRGAAPVSNPLLAWGAGYIHRGCSACENALSCKLPNCALSVGALHDSEKAKITQLGKDVCVLGCLWPLSKGIRTLAYRVETTGPWE